LWLDVSLCVEFEEKNRFLSSIFKKESFLSGGMEGFAMLQNLFE